MKSEVCGFLLTGPAEVAETGNHGVDGSVHHAYIGLLTGGVGVAHKGSNALPNLLPVPANHIEIVYLNLECFLYAFNCLNWYFDFYSVGGPTCTFM